MPRPKLKDPEALDGLWIVVVDGAHARVVMPSVDHRSYYTVREIASPRAHYRSAALASDRPGRGVERAAGRRYGMEPRADPHREAKQEFIGAVADEINQAGQHDEFRELVLVAPSRLLGGLQRRLASHVAARLAHTVPKDLTKVPDPELRPHLDEVLRRLRRRTRVG